ncbi:hypothetical protein ACJX0J_008071 [Zea mays]
MFLLLEKKIAVAVAHVLLHYLYLCNLARHYEAVVTSQFALLLAYFTSKAVLHVSLALVNKALCHFCIFKSAHYYGSYGTVFLSRFSWDCSQGYWIRNKDMFSCFQEIT